MYIKPFAVEEWMNEYEVGARFNIAETCVDSVSLDELFALAGADKAQFLTDFCAKRLTYGDIVGSDALRGGICKLYKTVQPRQVVPTHGAAGANHHVFCSLIAAGDRVVSIMPTYQQLYSIPEAIGANVAIMHLKQENDYLPDLEELRALVTPETKMICINNPNNPTGALMSEAQLQAFLSHRDYNLISCGMFDDAVASIALAHSDVMLKRNQTIVRENLAILDDWVASHPHFYYTKPKAGTTALVYYDFDVPSYDFCKQMYHQTGAFVTPGDCFQQPHSMRIGYACDKQTLKDGLAALAAFADTL